MRTTRISFTQLATVVLFGTHAIGALADASGPAGTAALAPSAAEPATPWKVAFGPGLIVTPQYPGSHELRYIPYPALDISWNDRVFSQGPDVLGLNVLRGENYHVGTSISLDFQSRQEKDDPHLHGLGDVDSSAKLKVFADYTVWAFTGSIALYQDISGHGQGKYVTTDLYASLPAGGWLFSFGPGFTWADALYTRTFFGVSERQSAASGLPAYNTSSGIRDVHLNGYASYDISRHWVASVAVTLGRLQHYAGGSPITERRSELNTLASVNYRF
ncbi:MipA/OmpV family protein [Paraburkholderia bengalensis]|uniref:MipA/OmpV family protein n=2 Tax=Paraburkholderia bengalensis TaxID=2747562 RepID=A0ABU8J552_9BURK